VEHELAADGASYCPAFWLLDDTCDDALAAALGRPVTDGIPEPRPDETEPQWWAVTVIAGVATDDEGRPAHGDSTSTRWPASTPIDTLPSCASTSGR